MGDRICYEDLCNEVSYRPSGSTAQARCQGWGRVAVDSLAGWIPDEDMVTDFGVDGGCVKARFQFKASSDIGSISLYLTPKIPWNAIASLELHAFVSGSPPPIVELSLEEQGTNLGEIARLDYISGDLFVSSYDLDDPSHLQCFAIGGCSSHVDLLNFRIRPRNMQDSDTGVGTLRVCGVVIDYR